MVGKKRVSKFNISNKLAYTLIVILSIVLIGVGVYAYGGTTPATMGHSAGELAPPAGCTAGQVLTWSGSAWACANPRYIPSDVKFTTALHNGDFRITTYGHYNSGYENMNDWIQDNGCSGYHVCTLEEVVTYAQINHAFVAGTGWVSSGYSVGVSSDLRTDCEGWTWADGKGTAVTIYSNYIVPKSLDCSLSSWGVTCCK